MPGSTEVPTLRGYRLAPIVQPPDLTGYTSDLGWQEQGLCLGADPEIFFPERTGSTKEAKKLCGHCAVRNQCLEWALKTNEPYGVWGGLSERERNKLRRQAV